MKIKNILIVGTGTLGSQIGFQCARHGFKTTMYDLKEESLEFCKKSHQEIGEATKADLGLDDDAIALAHANLSYTTDLAAAAKDCDLVSESVPENPDLKRKVFAELNEACPDHTIFTTNSSTLLPSEIADGTGRPERFLALHFANRIWVANVGEVMRHPGTDPEVFERVLKFATEIGMVPNGIASPQDVDRTWMISTHVPAGPFATMDIVGLETVFAIGDHWANVTGDEQKRRNADWLKENYLNKGLLGIKSGEGFYKYPDPEFAKPEFLK